MEYLPGGDLMNLLIEKDIFTEDQTRFYMAEAILAVESVHQLSYIHRDLKPDNIMLTKDQSTAKLIDFGLHSRIYQSGTEYVAACCVWLASISSLWCTVSVACSDQALV